MPARRATELQHANREREPGAACRAPLSRPCFGWRGLWLGAVPAARRRCRQRPHRRPRHRPDRRGRTAAHRRRPHPGFGRARRRRHRAPHRGARARGRQPLGGVRARQYRRRADRPADRRAALPDGRLRPVLARSRPVARRHRDAERGRAARAAGFGDRRHLPRHARSRHGRDLRAGASLRQPAAALSVGARRLQGQGQFLHALLRHRHRHFRIAGAVPDHPVRGEGLGDVPGRRGARLGGAGLYRHRFRILGQGVRHVGRRRAHLARDRRMRAGRDPAGVPVRLSQSQSLACALRPHHHRLARRPRGADRGRLVRSGGRVRHRALLARRRRRSAGLRWWCCCRRTASTARCC